MLAPLVGLVLAAAPLKIASAGLGGVGVDEKLLEALGEQVALELAKAPNVSVITRQDVAALLGIERQKQLLGCADESSSCVAELAGALGAGLVLSGDVARVGERFTATLKLLDARTSRAAYSGAGDAANEDELLALVKRLARDARLSVQVSEPVRWQPALPLIAGLGLAAGGAALLFRANQNVASIGALQGSQLSEGARLRDEGKTFAAIGTALVIAGGVAVAASLVWWLWPQSPRVALVPARDGLMFALEGALP